MILCIPFLLSPEHPWDCFPFFCLYNCLWSVFPVIPEIFNSCHLHFHWCVLIYFRSLISIFPGTLHRWVGKEMCILCILCIHSRTYYFHSLEHFIVLVWYYHIPGLPYILFFIFQSPKQWSQAVRRVATSYTRPWTGLLPSEGWYEWITVWGSNITGSYMRSKAGNCPVDSEDRGYVLCRTSVFRNTEKIEEIYDSSFQWDLRNIL